MVDLLVLPSLDQLIFIMEILFTFVIKQAALMRRSTILSLPLQLVFPVLCVDENASWQTDSEPL
jgi:hypothetical protein